MALRSAATNDRLSFRECAGRTSGVSGDSVSVEPTHVSTNASSEPQACVGPYRPCSTFEKLVVATWAHIRIWGQKRFSAPGKE